MIGGLRACREHGVQQLASAMEEARASRPVARCRSGSSTSAIAIPARAASIEAPTSQPKPAASGKQTARASAEKTRWPESGSPGRSRSAPGSTRAAASPEAAALPLGEDGDRQAALGGRQRSEVAGEIRVAHDTAPGGASRSASVSAWPLPRAGRRRTCPCSLRRLRRAVGRAVVGDDHLRAGNCSCNRSTVGPMRSASSLAAIRTATGSAIRERGERQRLDRRAASRLGRRLQP